MNGNKEPLISIIVPVYNTEKYLKDCVESILNQSYKNIEIILVDDGSKDSSPEICDEYVNKDKRIVVLHKTNGGVSAARNSGIDIATGEWIAFVDSDDFISTNYIETLAGLLTNERDLPCVSHYKFSVEVPKEITEGKPPITIYSFKNYISLHGGFPFSALYNSKIIRENNLRFNVSMNYVEDVLWNATYFYYIDKAIFLAKKNYYYRKHDSSATSKCSNKQWVVTNWFKCRNSSIDWYIENNIDKSFLSRLKEHVRICNNNIFAEIIKGNLSFRDYREIKATSFHLKKKKKLLFLFGAEYLFEKYFSLLYFNLYKLVLKLF